MLSFLSAVQEQGAVALERQISFSSLMASADLEAHQLSFHQVDLPLTYPETLVLCQSYGLVDLSFVSKLSKIDSASRFLVLMGVGRIMGMFLAFPPGKVPTVVHQYMRTLEKLTRLVTQALGFELPLLQKIVANSQSVSRPLLSTQGKEQLLRRLKRRRKSTTELAMGNRSMELLINEPKDFTEAGPSFSV